MGEVVYSRRASKNIETIQAFYDKFDDVTSMKALRTVVFSLNKLSELPQVGRPVPGYEHLRERTIAFGSQGFVALYRIDAHLNRVYVLAIRHQREAGYGHEDVN